MSVRLARAVLESSLDAELKPAATVLALHAPAGADGTVDASLGHVAWLLGRSERHVRRLVSRLKRLGILEPAVGRHSASRCRLLVERLPQRTAAAQRGRRRPGKPRRHPDARVRPVADNHARNPHRVNGVGAFLDRFDALHTKHRQGARYEVREWKDLRILPGLLRTYGPERLERIADLLLSLTPEVAAAAGTPPTISGLSRGAAWLDRQLAENGR